MKFFRCELPHTAAWSLPMRGVWIEIKCEIKTYIKGKSLPMRGVWIEIVEHMVTDKV